MLVRMYHKICSYTATANKAADTRSFRIYFTRGRHTGEKSLPPMCFRRDRSLEIIDIRAVSAVTRCAPTYLPDRKTHRVGSDPLRLIRQMLSAYTNIYRNLGNGQFGFVRFPRPIYSRSPRRIAATNERRRTPPAERQESGTSPRIITISP